MFHGGDHAASHGVVQTFRRHGRTWVPQSLNGTQSSADSAGTPSSRGVELVPGATKVTGRLRDVAADAGSLGPIARHALDDWLVQQVPRSARRDEVEGILCAAW